MPQRTIAGAKGGVVGELAQGLLYAPVSPNPSSDNSEGNDMADVPGMTSREPANGDEQGAEDEIDPELEALLGLAQMDAEAAVAYQIVADYVTAPALKRKLLEFARDHERHVNDIGEYLVEQGVETDIALPDPETSPFATLANAMAGISNRSAVQALQADELFTDAAYTTALEVVSEPEAFLLVRRHLADEERHARWLFEHHDSDWEARESHYDPRS